MDDELTMPNKVKGVEIDPVREKLVELLRHDNCPLFMVFGDNVDVLADYLIANGVTVLPLKIGDVVYFPIEDYHDSAIIDGINITAQGISFTWVQYEVGVDITECWDDGEFGIEEIGESVFLTREEAEAATAWNRRQTDAT